MNRMPREIKPVRRLPLEGANNTRDLGGYPCAGGVTRWKVFLRSDRPSALTPADVELLRAYGVTDAVDLRGAAESERLPSLLGAANGFAGHHVPVSDHIHDVDYEGDLPGSMSGLYISLLDEVQHGLAQVFEIFAAAKGACLFNCTVGKDRTGVVAMLLLGLAGVADDDIVADYMTTEVYMGEFIDRHIAEAELPLYVLQSKPESMRRALAHLHDVYGGAGQYLLGAGVAKQALDALRERLVEPL